MAQPTCAMLSPRWNGIYVGINGGWGFGQGGWIGPVSTGSFHVNGGLVGATLGGH